MNLKSFVIIVFFCSIGLSVQAQRFQERLEERREQIEKIKKEFVTDRINLTDEQAIKFWPIYDEYIQNRIKLRRRTQKLKQSGFSMAATDEQIKASIDKMFELRKQELQLDLENKEKLLKVLNVRQLAELYRSEQEFIKVILQSLRNRN